jgi:3-hydroxyisobutyrate dehydrogenase/2-hydroxy-3-oxopropionate reductase
MKMETKRTILVVGLGSMGFGMADSLLRAGHKVYGADIDPQKTDDLCAKGAIAAENMGEDLADILVSVVLNAPQTETVLFGAPDYAKRLKPGGVIVACATVPPAFAKKMETKAQAGGLHYLDAPISGGAIKAAAGQLSIMASGTEAAFSAAEPALQAMAATVHRLGNEAGPGSAMKSVNQLLAGVHIAAMGEALTLGLSQGLPVDRMIDVISQSAGTSWMFENRAPHVRDGDYSPRSTITIWPKDLGIVSDIARSAGFDVPITETALAQYKKAVVAGLGQEDDAAIIKPYAAAAGLKLPGEA